VHPLQGVSGLQAFYVQQVQPAPDPYFSAEKGGRQNGLQPLMRQAGVAVGAVGAAGATVFTMESWLHATWLNVL